MAPDLLRKLTHVQTRMLYLLADGMIHPRSDLHACLYDTDGGPNNIQAHLTTMRAILEQFGLTIQSFARGPNAGRYRLCRLLRAPE